MIVIMVNRAIENSKKRRKSERFFREAAEEVVRIGTRRDVKGVSTRAM